MSKIFGPITQLGYVVDDLDAAIDYWVNTLGVGPFFLIPPFKFKSCVYRGVQCDPHLRVAVANSGGLQIELIQQTNDEFSFYTDFLDKNNGSGLQHVSVWSDQYDEDLARYKSLEMEPFMDAVIDLGDGIRVVFYETTSHGAPSMEVLEAHTMFDTFKMIRDAANNWDGNDPIRNL